MHNNPTNPKKVDQINTISKGVNITFRVDAQLSQPTTEKPQDTLYTETNDYYIDTNILDII